jgi:hypothetical protein
MRNLRKLCAGLVCLFFLAFSMVSCLKEGEVPFQGIADVFIQDIKTDTGVRANSHFFI